MTKELSEKSKDWTALLMGLTALLTAAKELYEALRGPAEDLRNNWPWFVVPAVIFLLILLWRRDRLMRWLAPRSTVLKREAFQIGRKYLKGREEDIENLLRLLSDWPLVFLVGESGAGKSSLIERGVLRKLKEEDPSRLAIFVNTWGPDWVEGPREAVALALNPLLTEDIRKRLGLEGPVPPAEALKVLGNLREKAGILPVLFFDQFDDYQVRHRAKFLSGPNRTVLGAKELMHKNVFWKGIAGLLQSGSVRCLFVTRADAKVGLESVEFLPEEQRKTYLLDPLDKRAAADLLDEITKDGAVDRPDRGFDRLKERLLGDLSTDGWVLPIQMQVAFSGLADLRALIPGEYERQGRLPGLEALYLETRVAAAARVLGWSAADVRAILLKMVDPVEQKTIPKNEAQLVEALPEGRRDTAKIKDLLEKLEGDEVVRQRIDPGREEGVWQLDHDYLSRGLLELERRDQRWVLYLKESARAAAGARGPWDWWRKLLPPGMQVRLLYERVRGRLRYGQAAGYAWASSLRIILNLWVLIAASALIGWNLYSVDAMADRLFAELGQESMTKGELRALWELSQSKVNVRRAFISKALSRPADAQRFNVRSQAAIHAAIGLDVDNQNDFLNMVQDKCANLAEDRLVALSLVDACLALMKVLGVGPSEQGKLVLEFMKGSRDALVTVDLIQRLASLDGKMDVETSRQASTLSLQKCPGGPQ